MVTSVRTFDGNSDVLWSQSRQSHRVEAPSDANNKWGGRSYRIAVSIAGCDVPAVRLLVPLVALLYIRYMGIIRKVLSGSAAMMTGGASLAAFQFRSDTERGTRETKKLRKTIQNQSSPPGVSVSEPNVVVGQQILGAGSTDALRLTSDSLAESAPSDRSAGWKVDPSAPSNERFWSGSAWTGITRGSQIQAE